MGALYAVTVIQLYFQRFKELTVFKNSVRGGEWSFNNHGPHKSFAKFHRPHILDFLSSYVCLAVSVFF